MPEAERRSAASVSVGEELGPMTVKLDRARLVRYAGAALDFNPIHWSEQAAAAAGLPDVIAHGMLTMAVAGRLVTDWAGDPGAVERFDTRFSGMVPVGADAPAEVVIRGEVTEVEGHRATVELTVEVAGRPVLKAARAVIRLAR